MRKNLFLGLLLVIAVGASALEAQASNWLKGDYVEARTASVFAGACHFNGEVVTTGREAVMAWHIKAGKWNGVDMAGVRAIAVITADDNLSEAQAARQSEVIVDSSATEAQHAALLEAFKTKYAASLGTIASVQRARITFQRKADTYMVEAPGFASLSVQAMPNAECCKMPNMVWYSPLVPLSHRKVGYTKQAVYEGGAAGVPWQRGGENSAIYGSFTL